MRHELDRFLSKTQENSSGCLLWMGASTRFGYGHFRRKINGQWKMYKAHRFSYEQLYGPVPDGLCVLHSCDNPKCVNPNHLSVGTKKDNAQQRKQRGRQRWGRNPQHNWLTFALAQIIRQYQRDNPTMKQKNIAEVFGISTAQCSRILNNHIWQQPEEV